MTGCWLPRFGRPDTGSLGPLAAYAGDGFAGGRDGCWNRARVEAADRGGFDRRRRRNRGNGGRQFADAMNVRLNAREGNIARNRACDAMTSQRFASHDDPVNEKDRCANTSPLQRSLIVWALGNRSDRRQTA